MTPETELTLLCAAPLEEPARTARLAEILARPLDWVYLAELAESHRLLPLLHWQMNAVRPDLIPPNLEQAYRANLKNSLLLTRELVSLLESLHRASIPALPFKGPTLGLAAYGNLALRSFCDLDILIPREDVWRAHDILAAQGYTTKLQLNHARRPDYLNAYDEIVMTGPESDGNLAPLVELHWAFVPPHFPFPLTFDACWARREHLRVANRTLPALHAEDLLLVLCVHGSKHCWSHLGLVCDVAWLLAKHSFEWPVVLRQAASLGVLRMLLLGHLLASNLLRVPLPLAIAKAIEDDAAVVPLVREITDALLGERHDESSIRANAALHLRLRERLRDRAVYFTRLALRPGIEDWELINLPRPLSFLYRLLRFPRLVRKYRSRLPGTAAQHTRPKP